MPAGLPAGTTSAGWLTATGRGSSTTPSSSARAIVASSAVTRTSAGAPETTWETRSEDPAAEIVTSSPVCSETCSATSASEAATKTVSSGRSGSAGSAEHAAMTVTSASACTSAGGAAGRAAVSRPASGRTALVTGQGLDQLEMLRQAAGGCDRTHDDLLDGAVEAGEPLPQRRTVLGQHRGGERAVPVPGEVGGIGGDRRVLLGLTAGDLVRGRADRAPHVQRRLAGTGARTGAVGITGAAGLLLGRSPVPIPVLGRVTSELRREPVEQHAVRLDRAETPHPRPERADDDGDVQSVVDPPDRLAGRGQRAGPPAGADAEDEPVRGQGELTDPVDHAVGGEQLHREHAGGQAQRPGDLGGDGDDAERVPGASGLVHPERVEPGAFDGGCEFPDDLRVEVAGDPETDAAHALPPGGVSTTTVVALTTAVASEPGSRPSSSAASRLMR